MTDNSRTPPLEEMRRIILFQRGDCEFSGQTLTNHRHTHDYEVCYVLEGSGIQIHGSETIEVSKHDVFLAEPGVEHEVNAFGSGYLRVFYFVFQLTPLPGDLSDGGVVSNFINGHDLHARGQTHLRPFIEQIVNFHAMGSHQSQWAESTSILFLLAALQCLTNEVSQGHPLGHPAVDKAMDFIRRRAAERPTLSSIAQFAGTSPRNLQLLFRKHLNRTVIEALNAERCEVASRYLDMGFRIADTGPVIGIDDPCQFSRFFKTYTGVSPSTYRAQKSG